MSVPTQYIATIENEVVADAYAEIADFFDCNALSTARRDLAYYMKAAVREGGCKKGDPADVLCFFERMEKLLYAAWVIAHYGSKRSNAILSTENENSPDVTDFSRYCGSHRGEGPWDFLPRSLSKKEYNNPYKALKKVVTRCSLEDWKTCLKEMITYSLSKNEIAEFYSYLHPLEAYILLNKLLDACHLIEVRAIDEVDGKPVPKWQDNEEPDDEEPDEETDESEEMDPDES